MSGRPAKSARGSIPFDARFPAIARWVLREGGRVEVGGDDFSRSMVRALDEGGMVWEGAENYASLDEALAALDAGIAAWLAENRPGRGHVAVEPRSKPPRPARHPASPAAEKKESTRQGNPAVPRAVAAKVRKLAEVAAALRAGEHFNITRLTGLKGLCDEPEPARAFALFLAAQARRAVGGKDVPGHYGLLMDRAISGLRAFLEGGTEAQGEHLHGLLRGLQREQDEYRSIRWGQVRVVHSREMLVVEKALKAVLRPHEAAPWLYQAARDYAERYDPRHGTGLIPASAPMVQEIADFWREYHGLDHR